MLVRPVLASLKGALFIAGVPLLFAASPAVAQSVSGVVTVEGSDEPIAQAEVALLDSAGATVSATFTDREGGFRVNAESAGDHTLRVTHLSFADFTSSVLALEVAKTTVVRVRLTVQAIALEPLTVVGIRYMDTPRLREFYDRADRTVQRGMGRAYFREDLQRMGNLQQIFWDVPVRPPLGVYSRAACAYDFYVDGRKVLVDGMQSMGSPLQYEGVEVYWGMNIPLEYRGLGSCGVVLMWNRPGDRPFSWGRLIFVGVLGGLMLLLH